MVRLIVDQLARIGELDAIVREEGLMSRFAQGPRVHPAAVESRQLAMSVGRLTTALGRPAELQQHVESTLDVLRRRRDEREAATEASSG